MRFVANPKSLTGSHNESCTRAANPFGDGRTRVADHLFEVVEAYNDVAAIGDHPTQMIAVVVGAWRPKGLIDLGFDIVSRARVREIDEDAVVVKPFSQKACLANSGSARQRNNSRAILEQLRDRLDFSLALNEHGSLSLWSGTQIVWICLVLFCRRSRPW